MLPGKTAENLRPNQQFPREMIPEKRAQKFHTEDALLPSYG